MCRLQVDGDLAVPCCHQLVRKFTTTCGACSNYIKWLLKLHKYEIKTSQTLNFICTSWRRDISLFLLRRSEVLQRQREREKKRKEKTDAVAKQRLQPLRNPPSFPVGFPPQRLSGPLYSSWQTQRRVRRVSVFVHNKAQIPWAVLYQ